MPSGIMRKNTATVLAVAAFAYFMPAFASAENTTPAPAEVKSIAEDAYIFAYPMLYGYQTLYNQTQDATFPGYIGGFGQYRHYARAATPADLDIVTPNNEPAHAMANSGAFSQKYFSAFSASLHSCISSNITSVFCGNMA